MRCWRVGDGLESVLLQARGWRKIPGKGRGYDYLVPPPGREPSLRIEAETPLIADVEAFAEAVHAKGERADGMLGEWPWRYRPASFYTVTTGSKVERHRSPAQFLVGTYGTAFRWGRSWKDEAAA